jgi:hypothetical protein
VAQHSQPAVPLIWGVVMSVINFARYVLVMSALVVSAVAEVASISGAVLNKTTGKPSSGDEVILVDVSADMREVARIRTNVLGHFQFQGFQRNTPHVVRIIHDGVRYDSTVSSTDQAVNVTVFNSTAAVKAVKTSVQAVRIEAAGENFRITEMLTVLNSSNPPETVTKRQLFWLTLPKSATIISSAAQAPDSDALENVAVAVPKEERAYFNFPLRPGTTKIQMQYEMPSSGQARFVPYAPFPAETLGVVFSNSLKFETSQLSGYVRDSDQHGDLAEVIHDVATGSAPSFTISAATEGILDTNKERGDSLAGVLSLADRSSGNRSASLTTPNEQALPLRWVIVAISTVVCMITVVLFRRRRKASAPQFASGSGQPEKALKDQFFDLESARIQNRISKAGYTRSRSSLERRLAAMSSGSTARD